MTDSCNLCRFATMGPGPSGDVVMVCRRLPPHVLHMKVSTGLRDVDRIISMFPIVSPALSCGEYQPSDRPLMDPLPQPSAEGLQGLEKVN